MSLKIKDKEVLYDLTREEVVKIVKDTSKFNSLNNSNISLNEDNQGLPSHPNTIKIYTAAMIGLFSNVETEYNNITKTYNKLPVIFATREKLIDIEKKDFQELLNGNTNFIPRASLSIESISYDNQRALNKSLTFPIKNSLGLVNYKSEVMPSPTPYNLTYRLSIITRGFSDAFMITEQIASLFNPTYTLELYDFDGLDQPSKIVIKLESCNFTPPDVDEYSQNEVLTEFEFTVYGNLYKPLKLENVVSNYNLNII